MISTELLALRERLEAARRHGLPKAVWDREMSVLTAIAEALRAEEEAAGRDPTGPLSQRAWQLAEAVAAQRGQQLPATPWTGALVHDLRDIAAAVRALESQAVPPPARAAAPPAGADGKVVDLDRARRRPPRPGWPQPTGGGDAA